MNERVWVKICGVTTPENAAAVEEAGADAVGLMFVPESKRFVTPARAREVVSALGPFTARVGVFRDAPLPEVLRVAASVGLSAVQLNGREDAAFVAAVARHHPVVVASRAAPLEARRLVDGATLLLDGPDPGSGVAFDWSTLDLSALRGRRWLLAGGLTPSNVAAAVARLSPWGVDVSSGVESAPGVKDAERVRSFVLAARKLSTGGVIAVDKGAAR